MKVDIEKLKELKARVAQLERMLEQTVTDVTRESTRIAENIRSSYPEHYVRSACEDILATARDINQANRRVTDRLHTKVKGFDQAIYTYMNTEKQLSRTSFFFSLSFRDFYERIFRSGIRGSFGTTKWIIRAENKEQALGNYRIMPGAMVSPKTFPWISDQGTTPANARTINGKVYIKAEVIAKAIGASVSTSGMPPGYYWFSKDAVYKKVAANDGYVPLSDVADRFRRNGQWGGDTSKILMNGGFITASTWGAEVNQGTSKNNNTSTTIKNPEPSPISNTQALKNSWNDLKKIPQTVSSGVQQTWNDPNTKQALINTGYSVVKAHVPFKVDIALSPLPVNISSGDKELDTAWDYVDYSKIISPSTAIEVDGMWGDIKKWFKKK